MKKRLVAWAATAGLTAALGLVGTATPALAATCFESSCNGKALAGTDCTTNQLIYSDFSLSGVVAIQLMYSPGCHAFWGEMQVTGGTASAALWAVPQYDGAETLLEAGSGSGVETHMWSSAERSVKFCWSQQPSADLGDNAPDSAAIFDCTSWR